MKWKGWYGDDNKTWEPRRSFRVGRTYCQKLLDYETLHGLLPPPTVTNKQTDVIQKAAQGVVPNPDGGVRTVYWDKCGRELYEVEAIEAHQMVGKSCR